MSNIIINSQFNPFTYEELLAPVQAATTEHKQLEAELGSLQTQASVWEKLANNENDKNAYNQYKTYIDDLNSKVNTLSELGLTPGARQSLYNSAQRYAKEIIPISQADEMRQKDIAAQQDIRLKDSSYIFDKTASDVGLDHYLKNGNLKYNGLSVNEVYGTVAKDFEQAASKLMREGKWKTTLGGQYYERNNQSGYTQEEIQSVINGDENAPEELKQLYNNTLNSYLSRGEWDESGQASIKEAINRGAFYGIGSSKSEMQANRAFGMKSTSPNGEDTDKDDNPWLKSFAEQNRVDINNKELNKYKGVIGKYYIQDRTGEYVPNPAYWNKDEDGKYRLKDTYIEKITQVNPWGSVSTGNALYGGTEEADTPLDPSDMAILSPKELRNMTSDEIFPLLKQHENSLATQYAVYDINGTDYKFAENGIKSETIRQKETMGGKRLPGVKNSEGKNVKGTVFKKSLDEGILSMQYNRNNNNPGFNITTSDGEMYELKADMVPGFTSAFNAINAEIQNNTMYHIALAQQRYDSGASSQEEYERNIRNIQKFAENEEYTKIAEFVLQGRNQTQSSTK